jgi:hypothetical protein
MTVPPPEGGGWRSVLTGDIEDINRGHRGRFTDDASGEILNALEEPDERERSIDVGCK